MPALDHAIAEVLNDTRMENLQRRIMQATLLDTNGDNAAAIEQAQMKTLARSSGMSPQFPSTDMGQSFEAQSPAQTGKSPDTDRSR